MENWIVLLDFIGVFSVDFSEMRRLVFKLLVTLFKSFHPKSKPAIGMLQWLNHELNSEIKQRIIKNNFVNNTAKEPGKTYQVLFLSECKQKAIFVKEGVHYQYKDLIIALILLPSLTESMHFSQKLGNFLFHHVVSCLKYLFEVLVRD